MISGITHRPDGRPPGLCSAGNEKMGVLDALGAEIQAIFQLGDPIDGKQLPVVGMGGKLDIHGVEQGFGQNEKGGGP